MEIEIDRLRFMSIRMPTSCVRVVVNREICVSDVLPGNELAAGL